MARILYTTDVEKNILMFALSHSASTQNNSHCGGRSVRAPVRLILIESGCWSKEQTVIVAACGVCPKRCVPKG